MSAVAVRRASPGFYVVCTGQIEGCRMPVHDKLYVKFSFVQGPDWTVMNGAQLGISQVALKSSAEAAMAEREDLVTWNYPLDITWRSTTVHGWPQLVLNVYGSNSWGDIVVRGYGCVHIPLQPGRFVRYLRLYSPVPATWAAQFRSWLFDRPPEFDDPHLTPHGRMAEVIRVKSTGVAKVVLNVTVRGIDDWRFDLGGGVAQPGEEPRVGAKLAASYNESALSSALSALNVLESRPRAQQSKTALRQTKFTADSGNAQGTAADGGGGEGEHERGYALKLRRKVDDKQIELPTPRDVDKFTGKERKPTDSAPQQQQEREQKEEKGKGAQAGGPSEFEQRRDSKESKRANTAAAATTTDEPPSLFDTQPHEQPHEQSQRRSQAEAQPRAERDSRAERTDRADDRGGVRMASGGLDVEYERFREQERQERPRDRDYGGGSGVGYGYARGPARTADDSQRAQWQREPSQQQYQQRGFVSPRTDRERDYGAGPAPGPGPSPRDYGSGGGYGGRYERERGNERDAYYRSGYGYSGGYGGGYAGGYAGGYDDRPRDARDSYYDDRPPLRLRAPSGPPRDDRDSYYGRQPLPAPLRSPPLDDRERERQIYDDRTGERYGLWQRPERERDYEPRGRAPSARDDVARAPAEQGRDWDRSRAFTDASPRRQFDERGAGGRADGDAPRRQ